MCVFIDGPLYVLLVKLEGRNFFKSSDGDFLLLFIRFVFGLRGRA